MCTVPGFLVVWGAVKLSSEIGFTNVTFGTRWSWAQREVTQPFQPCIFLVYHARILSLTWTRAFDVCERSISICIGCIGMIPRDQSPNCLIRSTIRLEKAKSALLDVRTGA